MKPQDGNEFSPKAFIDVKELLNREPAGDLKFSDLLECLAYRPRCPCANFSEESPFASVVCKICNGTKEMDSGSVKEALGVVLESSQKADQVWTDNMFGHIVWKMAGYKRL